MPSAPHRCRSVAAPLPLRSAWRAEGSGLAAFTQTLSSGRSRLDVLAPIFRPVFVSQAHKNVNRGGWSGSHCLCAHRCSHNSPPSYHNTSRLVLYKQDCDQLAEFWQAFPYSQKIRPLHSLRKVSLYLVLLYHVGLCYVL